MKSSKSAIRKVTRGFQITLPTSFRERYGLEVGDFVEVLEVAGTLLVRPVGVTRQDAQAELDNIFATSDAIRDQALAVDSDEEALALAKTEVRARRTSAKSRKV